MNPINITTEAREAAEPVVHNIRIAICQPCLDGIGQECHTPGCALYLHKVDLPITRELYEILPPSLLTADAARIAELERAVKAIISADESFEEALRTEDPRDQREDVDEAIAEMREAVQLCHNTMNPDIVSPAAVAPVEEWRMLDRDKDVLQEGDESKLGDEWIPVAPKWFGTVVDTDHPFRRRVQPEEAK